MPRKQKRLPPDLSTRRVHNALGRLGFVPREGGNHTIFFDPANRERHIAIPRHPKVKRNLLRALLKSVGITEKEFMDQY